MILFRAACAALLGAVVGCSGANGLPTVPVHGKVTFAGGPPPANGSVVFSPATTPQGIPARPVSAQFGLDGAYAASSFRNAEGLLPGTYDVSVKCYTGLPDESKRDSFADIDAVPADWRPAQLVIEEGQDEIELNLDVPKK